MNTELQEIAESAFADILAVAGQPAVFTGMRRSAGESRDLSLTVDVIIGTESESVDPSGILSPSGVNTVEVKVGRTSWPDPMPPQSGDAITADGGVSLRVVRVIPTAWGWRLDCTEAAP